MNKLLKDNSKDSPLQYVGRTLLRGIVVILPITIILFLLSLIFKFIRNLLTPLSELLDPGIDRPHWIVFIISGMILLLFIFIIGSVINNQSGRNAFSKFEKSYLRKIPLYGTIYDLVYQFTGLKKMPFSDVVLIDPFNTGVLMTGFVTEEITEDMFTVFVPTAPNPTNGNIYHVPREQITFLPAANPQDAMRTIVGMGTGTRSLFESQKKIDQISPD